MQKIIIGIDESSDVSYLLQSGIKQFYFGYLPDNFIRTYSTQASLNRRYRQKEQFISLDKAYETIDKIKQNNGSIYLALNGFSSNSLFLEYINDVFELFKDRVDGIIVANISTALFLKSRGYKNIVASNLFGVYSTEAVRFLQKSFAPTKIILPRDISLNKIETIVSTFPNQNFEVFLYGDNCKYSEAFCFVEHGFDSIGFGSLCSYAYTHKKPIKAPTPTFKQIVKSGKLTNDEKKEKLKKRYIDIDSLLDEIVIAYYKNDTKTLINNLKLLLNFDIYEFAKDKKVWQKSLALLEFIKIDEAKELLEKLKNSKSIIIDSYNIFHKTNTYSIKKSLEFFNKFSNIVSLKIPSRGRDHLKYLFEDKKEYNYQESQYLL